MSAEVHAMRDDLHAGPDSGYPNPGVDPAQDPGVDPAQDTRHAGGDQAWRKRRGRAWPGQGLELPHNLDAERGLLGAILIDNRMLERVSDFLRAHHFMANQHTLIFEACEKLLERGQVADPITLKRYLEQTESLADIGGPAYLAELVGGAPTVVNAHAYGRTVFDLALKRGLIALGHDVIEAAYTARDADDVQLLFKVRKLRAETVAAEDKLRLSRGELVVATEAQAEMERLLVFVASQLQGLPATLARMFDLTAEQTDRVHRHITEFQEQLARRLMDRGDDER